MKYCQKCEQRRPDDHNNCFFDGIILVTDAKSNEQKIIMLKIIIDEMLVSIAECSETKKTHDKKFQSIIDCPLCREEVIKKMSEIISLRNGASSTK